MKKMIPNAIARNTAKPEKNKDNDKRPPQGKIGKRKRASEFLNRHIERFMEQRGIDDQHLGQAMADMVRQIEEFEEAVYNRVTNYGRETT